MEKIEKYRSILKTKLSQYAAHRYTDMPMVSNRIIIDINENVFVLIVMGWHDKDYIHNLIFHIELKEGVIYIYEDRTDTGIVSELIDEGVSSPDIVMTYLEPPIIPEVLNLSKV